MSLYLKYRPKDFKSVVWQEEVKKTLENISKSLEIPHSFIFSWPRWTWKTSMARIFAKALNSKVLENWEIEENNFTKEIDSGSFIDLIEIDAASNSWVDSIRDLIAKIWFSPNISDKKIYIIDEAHMLSKAAFDALLKTMEEPPKFAFFVLATTEKHKVPETIISRCINFSFKKIAEEKVFERLKKICENEWIKFDEKALKILAKDCEWWLRDAISSLEKVSFKWEISLENVFESFWNFSGNLAENLVEKILEKNQEKSFEILKEVEEKNISLEFFIWKVLESFREEMKKSLEEKEKLKNILEKIEIFQEISENIKKSPIKFLALESWILKCF